MMAAPDDREMNGTQRAALLGVVLSVPVAMFVGPLGIALSVGTVALAWWQMPRFWRFAVTGLIGGAVSGLLILGVGFRLAMRVVAMLDPFRTPELTLEGTMLILVGIGAVFGGILGMLGHFLRAATETRTATVSGIFPASGVMVLLFASTDLRAELFELGAGAWLNIPMFGLIAVLYGIYAMRIADRVESRWARGRSVKESVQVPV